MLSKEEIQNTKIFNFAVIKSWFVDDVDSYKRPYKIVLKLKTIETLFKMNEKVISDIIIENQGLKMKGDRYLLFTEWCAKNAKFNHLYDKWLYNNQYFTTVELYKTYESTN